MAEAFLAWLERVPPRLRVYVEPRDAWIGAYVSPRVTYVCPVPFLVIAWKRRER